MTSTIMRTGLTGERWHLGDPDALSGIVVGQSTAGPIGDLPTTDTHPVVKVSPHSIRESLRLVLRQGDTLFADAANTPLLRYELIGGAGRTVVLSDPGHIKSLMVADPSIAPSATRMSPLRPILGSESVLTSIGARHKRQRALLMPHFHGKSVASYREDIARATTRAIDTWKVGEVIELADLGQQITLDVIMAAVFGIGDQRAPTPAERALRAEIIRLLRRSTWPAATVAQLINARNPEPIGFTRWALKPVDRAVYRVIAERRNSLGGNDILSVLLDARDESGGALSDDEIRDELMTLVLAGHETTSNSVAWTFERLTRHRDQYLKVRDEVRAGDGEDAVEALVNESMRSRPVVPMVAREMLVPWDFGGHHVDAGTVALVSILLLHHRDEIYPRPFAFDVERFRETKPSPQTLMPFGGGNRRCLGAALAMAELRIVVTEILRRVDLETHDRPGEKPHHRNVTMIPSDGGKVRAVKKL
ncbi:putative cytochrome P450 [Gordonia effusa NBRC 100432]|uniref:Putative cytochrome P450 n=1 Tax=Gordonia effusa NBRC 100432 TaxID=1077974 RepID=H0QZ63_9ACTN|nr:cytochrome P450 [Gordonia effusa]GAB18114.1 putative cytochrome P450 [Gordonia effusa NBRC 100432]